MLSPEDHTPPDFVLPHDGFVERAIKRPIRKFIYPAYNYAVDQWLRKRYRNSCLFDVDRWIWGQRGNDYENHRRRVNGILSLCGRRVLVAGCGTGRDLLSWARMKPASLVGVDWFNYRRAWVLLREEFARHAPSVQVRFMQGDLAGLSEFAADSIDVVGSDAVFEHVRDLPAVLREFKRVLRPGGILYATFGPLWYCWGGDHVSGFDRIESGFNHLILDQAAYRAYLDTMGGHKHSEDR